MPALSVLLLINNNDWHFAVMILRFWTARSGQTVQTEIRLKEQSGQAILKNILIAVLLPTHQNWPYPHKKKKNCHFVENIFFQSDDQTLVTDTTFSSSKSIISVAEKVYFKYSFFMYTICDPVYSLDVLKVSPDLYKKKNYLPT